MSLSCFGMSDAFLSGHATVEEVAAAPEIAGGRSRPLSITRDDRTMAITIEAWLAS